MANIVHCSSCNESVIYMKLEGRIDAKLNPIEVKPHEKGNILKNLGSNTYRIIKGEELEQCRTDGIALSVSHFSYCPFAKQYRRK